LPNGAAEKARRIEAHLDKVALSVPQEKSKNIGPGAHPQAVFKQMGVIYTPVLSEPLANAHAVIGFAQRRSNQLIFALK
jgi:hypothetical protein